MKFRVGACALLVCLAACSSEGTNSKFGDLVGSASPNAARGNQVSPVNAPRSPADSIANAPDLGALVSYPNKGVASKQEGAYTWYPIAISEEHALRAVATGEMVVPSPDGSQVKLRYERHVEHADGNWTWIGRVVDGDQRQEAILTFGERAVYGSIPQANGAPALNLQTMAGKLWAVVTDPSKVVSPNKGTNDVMVPPALALRASLASAASQARVTQGAVAAGAPATSANTIDVAIGYTQGFATAQGGQSAAVTRLNFLVEVGNQAFTNSLINGYLRIVNTVQVNYADDTANEAALGQLTGHNGTSAIAVPAALVPIRTARDQYGADLAVLVRKFQTPENDGCGIAWLNGADQTPISPTADDDFGFAVVSDGNDTGTDGKSYFCSPETLVHELGHLMGSAHDRDNSKVRPNDPAGPGNLQYGRYAYSFGMKTDNTSGNFYTIMAYGDDNQNFYRTFSSPLVARCGPTGNLVCGVTDQTDNARSLNQTIPVVATFRATVVPLGVVRGDLNGDGKADILMHHPATGGIYQYLMDGATITSGKEGGQTLGVGYTVRAVGDFNGDGLTDIVWSNGKDLRMTLLGSNGSYAAPAVVREFYPAGWVIVAGDDLDADGNDDILMHHPATGSVYQYLMTGSTIKAGRDGGVTMPIGYTVRAVGDFNGDGRADIVWSNGQDLRMTLLGSNGSFAPPVVFRQFYPAGWNIVSGGDLDGDGKGDILMHHPSTGAVYQYLMDGTTLKAGREGGVTLSVGYTVRATGDYNGDGLVDVVWSNGQDLRMTLMTTSGTFAAPVVIRQFYPAGWTLLENLRDAYGQAKSALRVDLNGDKKSDILMHHTASGSVYQYLMDGTTLAAGREGGVTLLVGYTARAVGDFNGDGLTDVIWSNGQDLRMTLMSSNGAYAAAVVFNQFYPAGWEIVSGDDLDGDGKGDILMHHPPTGSVYQYLMDGAVIRTGREGGVTLPVGYTVRAVGDYNGDGLADVVWSNGQDLRMTLMGSNGAFAAAVVIRQFYPSGWDIISGKDIDGDGKGDILMHHPSTGSLYQYLMDGATIRTGREGGITLASGYTVRAVGDYNGDGLTDIVISNGQDLRVSLMGGSGSFATPVVSRQFYPAGWSILNFK